MTEEDRTRQIIIDITQGKDILHKLQYDDRTRTIRTVPVNGDPDGAAAVFPQDLEFALRKGGN